MAVVVAVVAPATTQHTVGQVVAVVAPGATIWLLGRAVQQVPMVAQVSPAYPVLPLQAY